MTVATRIKYPKKLVCPPNGLSSGGVMDTTHPMCGRQYFLNPAGRLTAVESISCRHHRVFTDNNDENNGDNSGNNSTCISAVTAAFNPLYASNKNPCMNCSANPADRSAWSVSTEEPKRTWFLLNVQCSDDLCWSSKLASPVAGAMRSREQPEPHWAIVGAQQRSTCCSQPT